MILGQPSLQSLCTFDTVTVIGFAKLSTEDTRFAFSDCAAGSSILICKPQPHGSSWTILVSTVKTSANDECAVKQSATTVEILSNREIHD